jgi:hypothetical protein
MGTEPKLSYKARRRWSLFALVIGLPLYIVVCVSIMALMPPLHGLVQFAIYVFMGVAWAFPLKQIFLGVGKENPDA